MKRRRQQGGLWPKPPTRAEIDSRKLDVGDRVWLAGRPRVVAYINADGSVGTEPDTRPQPPQESPAPYRRKGSTE